MLPRLSGPVGKTGVRSERLGDAPITDGFAEAPRKSALYVGRGRNEPDAAVPSRHSEHWQVGDCRRPAPQLRIN